jgi:hypothetical protein
MKIIKYETKSNDYCLIHKTKMFIYYLIYKDKKYYYYESYSVKNYKKTKIVSSRLLKQPITKISSCDYDDFILSRKADDFLSKTKNDYHLVSETFGNDNCITFCVTDNNLKKIKQFKGQKYSPTFIFSYVLYRFGFNFSPHFHSYGEVFIQDINDKDKKKIKKYAGLMFYKYINYNFNDIKINFKYFTHSLNERFLIKSFIHYDEIFKIDINKINYFFNLNNNQKKISYIYYGMCYFSSLFFIDFIKKNNIKNSKISINSCLFKIKLCQTFFNDSNTYFFSPLNNLKNGWIFFTEPQYNKYIKLIKDKYMLNMIKKVKTIVI